MSDYGWTPHHTARSAPGPMSSHFWELRLLLLRRQKCFVVLASDSHSNRPAGRSERFPGHSVDRERQGRWIADAQHQLVTNEKLLMFTRVQQRPGKLFAIRKYTHPARPSGLEF